MPKSANFSTPLQFSDSWSSCEFATDCKDTRIQDMYAVRPVNIASALWAFLWANYSFARRIRLLLQAKLVFALTITTFGSCLICFSVCLVFFLRTFPPHTLLFRSFKFFAFLFAQPITSFLLFDVSSSFLTHSQRAWEVQLCLPKHEVCVGTRRWRFM